MRQCAFCGVECDSQIGMSREQKSVYWGGKRNGNVELTPKIVTFFCSDDHRNDFIEWQVPGGEIQTEKWDSNGED